MLWDGYLVCFSTVAGVGEAYEDAANCLWLLTNSKPCANCKSPIQKNEGCNHMQCAKVPTVQVFFLLATCFINVPVDIFWKSVPGLISLFIDMNLLSLGVVQVWLLLDLPGRVEEAQLLNRWLLPLYPLWSHPAARRAIQGDDRRGTITIILTTLGKNKHCHYFNMDLFFHTYTDM